jgi:beta-glucosidase
VADPEGLAVGWRALIDQPVAFAFGHGLSFTHFAYSWAAEPPKAAAEPGAVAFTVRVANDGAVAGAEVCQVYLAYPADAGEPPLVLRGFAKTPLLPPGGTVDLPFSLSTRDLSIWDDGWRVAPGGFTVRVGASSRDLRLSATFEYMPEK